MGPSQYGLNSRFSSFLSFFHHEFHCYLYTIDRWKEKHDIENELQEENQRHSFSKTQSICLHSIDDREIITIVLEYKSLTHDEEYSVCYFFINFNEDNQTLVCTFSVECISPTHQTRIAYSSADRLFIVNKNQVRMQS